jgi:hypothetical protein
MNSMMHRRKWTMHSRSNQVKSYSTCVMPSFPEYPILRNARWSLRPILAGTSSTHAHAMLCVIALAAYFIKQIPHAGVIGAVRHNHQVWSAIVEARGDDSVNGAHLILKIVPRLRIQCLVYMYHNVVDVHDPLLMKLPVVKITLDIRKSRHQKYNDNQPDELCLKTSAEAGNIAGIYHRLNPATPTIRRTPS